MCGPGIEPRKLWTTPGCRRRGHRRKAAPGSPRTQSGDGRTWRHYGEDLEANLQDLTERQRPLGVPTLEDKIVQRAVVEVLSAIYEADFLGFSYGFRPRRSPHQALDALTVGIMTKKVIWVLDADIRGFFDTSTTDGWSSSSSTVLRTGASCV